jgi:predicted AAA+ superfamily ATPase
MSLTIVLGPRHSGKTTFVDSLKNGHVVIDDYYGGREDLSNLKGLLNYKEHVIITIQYAKQLPPGIWSQADHVYLTGSNRNIDVSSVYTGPIPEFGPFQVVHINVKQQSVNIIETIKLEQDTLRFPI